MRLINFLTDCLDLPKTKNWLTEKKIPNVKNQMKCASSYLLSGISAIESAVAIEYGSNIMQLSTQHCLECIKNVTNGRYTGCSGGR